MGRIYEKLFLGLSRVIKLLCILLFIVLLFFYALRPISGTDSWRHIKLGELLFLNKSAVLNYDPLLFTTFYEGLASLNWLFQIIVYLLYKQGGFLGLSLFQVFIAFLTFYFFFKSLKTLELADFLFTGISIFIYNTIIEVRPHIISYLFLLSYVYLIWTKTVTKKQHFFYLIFMQLIWVNTHVYFFMGPLLVLFYLGERVIARDISNREIYKLGTLSISLLLVSLINPLGPKAYMVFIGTFTAFLGRNEYYVVKSLTIEELLSPFQTPLKYPIIFFILASSLSFIIVLLLRKGTKYLFLWAFFVFFSLYAARTAAVFGILAPIFISHNLYMLKDYFLKIKRDLVKLYGNAFWYIGKVLLFTVLLVAAVLSFKPILFQAFGITGVLSKCSRPDFKGIGGFTTEAIDYINSQNDNIPERMFNTYNNGSAITFFTGRKAFIDSRGNRSDFMKDYRLLSSPFETEQSYFSSLVDKYQLEGFIMNIENKDMVRRIHFDERFGLVYLDSKIAIFVKKSSDRDKLDKLKGSDWNNWVDEMVDNVYTGRIILTNSSFYVEVASLFFCLDKIELAKKLLQASLWLNPKDVAGYYNLGLCYLKDKNFDTAYEYFYKAFKLDPYDKRDVVCLYITADHLQRKDIAKSMEDIIKQYITKREMQLLVKAFNFIGFDFSELQEWYK